MNPRSPARLLPLLLSCVCGVAHADFVGTLGTGSITAPASVEFGNRTETNLTAGTVSSIYNFIDTWTFNLTDDAQVTSLTSAFSFVGTFGIENLQVNLYNATNDTVAVGWQTVIPLNPPANTSFYTLSLTPQTGLAAGNYELRVRGTLLSPPASYAGTLTAAAVPLPAAFPMLLLGLSALGITGSRGRKSTART